MNYDAIESPSLGDAKAVTGKPIDAWYAELDAAGGAAKGRKALVEHLWKELKVDPWWATTIVVEYEGARGVKEKDGQPPGYAICVTKSIASPVAKVFAAWSDEKQLAKWFGAGTKVKFQDGGRFENADGDAGEYLRIRKDKDLRFRWDHAKHGKGSQVDVAFKETGGKTGITLNHARIQSRRDADLLRGAWGRALDALKALG